MGTEVTVTREHYYDLLERERWLTALEAAGVDNWEGIPYAHEVLEEMEPKRVNIKNISWYVDK